MARTGAPARLTATPAMVWRLQAWSPSQRAPGRQVSPHYLKSFTWVALKQQGPDLRDRNAFSSLTIIGVS